jgi:ribosomal protein S24E
MKLTIIENKKNELLKRSEIKAETDEKSITRKDILANLSAQLNIAQEKIIVKKIDSNFGTIKKKIVANVYDDVKDLEKIENAFIKKRNNPKEEKK